MLGKYTDYCKGTLASVVERNNRKIYETTKMEIKEEKIKYYDSVQFHILSEQELINCCTQLEGEILQNINFLYGTKVIDFKDLCWKFFVNKLPTYYGNVLQCSAGRLRSIIDFYMIQKYYFENYLSLLECVKVYFALDRAKKYSYESNREYFASIKQTISEEKLNVFYQSLVNNYCSTVHRNVYTASNINKISKDEFYESIQLNKELILKQL